MTGAEYIEAHLDLKEAGVDAFQHFVANVMPLGELREPRTITVKIPGELPPDWNWEVYLAGWKDLRVNGLKTQEEAEAHYREFGCDEGSGEFGRWPIPPLPIYWEDDAYLFKYPDVAADSYYSRFPWAHYLDTKDEESRIYMPEGWDPAQYIANYPKDDFGGKPLLHWWKYGKDEGRNYKKPGWQPSTEQGLHHVLTLAGSQRCLFTGMKYKDGLLLGDYGLHVGGAKIQYWNGEKVVDEAHFTDPLAESVFHFVLAGDGIPIASGEHFGLMFRKDGPPEKPWRITYNSGEYVDLAFGIFKVGGNFYCLVCKGGYQEAHLIESTDDGRSWHKIKDYHDMQIGCGNSDGAVIRFTGERDSHPTVRDINGSVSIYRDDITGKGYTQLCGRSGLWNFLGDAWIDSWDGNNIRRVFESDRYHAMWSECDPYSQTRIALFSSWNQITYPDAQVAISRDDGKTWGELCKVPCPCLLGTYFADGGVYLFGGKYEDYGCVYFYKF